MEIEWLKLSLPANFRAAVKNRQDIADVKKIATGFKPKQKIEQ